MFDSLLSIIIGRHSKVIQMGQIIMDSVWNMDVRLNETWTSQQNITNSRLLAVIPKQNLITAFVFAFSNNGNCLIVHPKHFRIRHPLLVCLTSFMISSNIPNQNHDHKRWTTKSVSYSVHLSD
jgi:hypothetical protein